MSEARAIVCVLGSVVSIQFGQALGKQLAAEVGAGGVVALRLGLAALVLALVHRPGWPRRWADVRNSVALGTAIAGMNLIYPALRYLPLGYAIALQLLGPICLAVFTVRRPSGVALALLAGCGIWLFQAPAYAPATGTAGLLFALAAGASMAAYLVLNRRAGESHRTGAPLALALVWAALLTVPLGVAHAGAALVRPGTLLAGAGVALLSAVLPYSLELAALRRLRPATVAVLQSLEPAAAGVAGALVLDEQLRTIQWLALACVGVANAGTLLPRRAAARAGGRAARPSARPGSAASAGTGPARRRGSPGGCSGPGRWTSAR